MKRCCLALLVFVCLLFSVKTALAESDWEYWSQFQGKTDLRSGLSLFVKPELRFRKDMTEHYYSRIDIGLDWEINSWLVISPCLAHIDEERSKDWSSEERPLLIAAFKWTMFKKVKMSNRSRLEYRIMENSEAFRYLNKYTVYLPSVTALKIAPYLADEFFYNFDEGALNKNRVFLGGEIKISGNWKAGLSYILESRKKGTDWTDVNVLVTSIKYSF